jgi:hypothetical protein
MPDRHERPRVLVVDGHRKREFYAALVSAVDATWRSVAPPELLAGVPPDTDLVIVNDESWPWVGAALPELRRCGVPSLHLVDGILEWRNTWEHPGTQSEGDGMPRFQPVLADKIACIGRSQARLLESWGNAGKCEVTGSPRFDNIRRSARRRRPGDTYRVLVATARTPGFVAADLARVRDSLIDLRDWFTEHRAADGARVEPVWRVTGALSTAVDPDGATGGWSRTLSEQIETVDALITTPSTVQVEGMLAGVPVALVDYLNRPHYVPAAWTITAPSQIDETLRMLLAPDARRLLYQDTILHDAVECRSPAIPRLAQIIETMVSAGRDARREGRTLRLPDRIVPDDANGHHLSEDRFDPAELHPSHPVLTQRSVSELQAEVGHLRRAIRLSPSQTAYRILSGWERYVLDRLRPWSGR